MLLRAGGFYAAAGGAPAQQPPTFAAVATYTSTTTNTTPHTRTSVITVGAGAGRRLLVWVCNDDSRTTSAVRLTNSGGTLFTALGATVTAGGGNGRWWELRDPPTGATTLWISLSAAARIGVVVYSLRDCHASAAPTVGASATGATVTSLSPTVTPAFDAAMVLSAVMESSGTSQGNTAIGALNGQTDTGLVELGTPASSTATMKGGRSTGPTPAALVTHGWSFNRGGGVANAIGVAISVPGLLT